ncbi:MAG: histidine--tRNA ligase [Methanomassiliicoccales archaeon]
MIQRIRGTRDFTPAEMHKRREMETFLRNISLHFGFSEVLTPVMEHAELFVAKSGPGVLEEMYSFEDRGGRKLALRPELTAPIIRFYVNELLDRPLPLKLFSISNCFRYEEPQLGRYREFYHYDVEIIGSSEPAADAELLLLSDYVCKSLHLSSYKYRIGHVGIIRDALHAAGVPKEREAEFLHLIDKKRLEDAETLLEGMTSSTKAEEIMLLCRTRGDISVLSSLGKTAEHLTRVLELASGAGFGNFEVDLGVVRGLDYYTGLVFEIDFPELGAEKQICGGGSYRLSHLFGGPDTPATGFAFGFDRLLIAAEKSGWKPAGIRTDAFVIAVEPVREEEAAALAMNLRRSGLSVDYDLMGRNLSRALKYCASAGVRFALIIGERERKEGVVLLRDMETGMEEKVPVARLSERIME